MTHPPRPADAPAPAVFTYRVGMATGSHRDRDQAFLLAFGMNLKLARTARGASQQDFADLIGVHRTFLGQLERAQRGANITLLARIAEALDMPPAHLLPVLVTDHPHPTNRKTDQ